MSPKGKILVTGGTGYIGSITSAELIEQGYEVVIIDNLSNSEKDTLDRIQDITGILPHFYEYDLQEQESIERVITEHPDILGIIHFAAAKAVGESVEMPLHYYRNNIVPMINILESMKIHNISNFVFSSSCTVYGQPDELPVTELAPVKPAESPYGYTKQVNENLLKDTIQANTGIKGIALRYFNPIGAHLSGNLGELPLGVPDNLMPYITQTAIGIREELKVFGDDYNTPDGSCIRDYIHVVDLARAHVVALERMMQNKGKADYEVFNIGTGNGVSVLEIIDSFEKATGVKLNYKIADRRVGDIEQIWANTDFTNNVLGWKASLTLDQMTKSAWEWEKNYRESLKTN
jgi:UDP-glucose 4-epimerase